MKFDWLSAKFENIILLGDFNSCRDDSPVIAFCETYKLRNLVKHSTCYKNPQNPLCIVLFLTKKLLTFQTTTVIETELSDFHKMVAAIMKMSFPKMKLKVIRYRNYKTFNNDAFVNSLRKELISQKKVLDFRFSEHCTKVLDKHVSPRSPPKKKQKQKQTAKQTVFKVKPSKAIITRARLGDHFLKNRNNRNRFLFRKQGNLLVNLLTKSKEKLLHKAEQKTSNRKQTFYRIKFNLEKELI